jgi:hypothetical protein
MKYFILINQLGIVESGLHTKTDMIDWAIIDYLQQWYFAERKKAIFNTDDNNHYVWVNYNHLIQEMPLLGIKDKDAITMRFKKLKKLNLIKTIQTKDNSLYFVLTPECIEIIGFKSVNKSLNTNQAILPNSDRLSYDDRTGCPMTIGQGLSYDDRTAQTYNHIKHITSNIYSNNSIQFSNENFIPTTPETSLEISSKGDNNGTSKHKQVDITFDEETFTFKGIEPYMDKWREAYPAVDVESEIKKMESWVMSQPKTRWKKNWKRFITGWLAREQEKQEFKKAKFGERRSFLDD